MKNKHLTYEERHEIENMLAKGNSISQITAHLI
ncbi:helix-turn-helix domain-containing protein [Peptostreptococcus anaerobius]